jgi:hypothetical protein
VPPDDKGRLSTTNGGSKEHARRGLERCERGFNAPACLRICGCAPMAFRINADDFHPDLGQFGKSMIYVLIKPEGLRSPSRRASGSNYFLRLLDRASISVFRTLKIGSAIERN